MLSLAEEELTITVDLIVNFGSSHGCKTAVAFKTYSVFNNFLTWLRVSSGKKFCKAQKFLLRFYGLLVLPFLRRNYKLPSLKASR
jgi:hypothetical protein